jgi:acetylcholinesterase
MESQYEGLVNETGCSNSEDSLGCLRSANISSLILFNTPGIITGALGNARWYWLPVEDGDFIRGDKWDIFDDGQFIKVPLLVTNDNNEGAGFVSNASTSSNVKTFFKYNYPKLSDDQLQDIISMYPLMDPLPQHSAWYPSASAAYGDATFICAGNSLAASMAQYLCPAKVWAYRCYITSASTIAAGTGTPHTFEMPAILGTQLGPSVSNTWFNENAASIPITMHYYISFIRALNPNTYRLPTSPVWKSWGTGTGRILHLETNATYMEHVSENVTQACSFWDGLSMTMEV